MTTTSKIPQLLSKIDEVVPLHALESLVLSSMFRFGESGCTSELLEAISFLEIAVVKNNQAAAENLEARSKREDFDARSSAMHAAGDKVVTDALQSRNDKENMRKNFDANMGRSVDLSGGGTFTSSVDHLGRRTFTET